MKRIKRKFLTIILVIIMSIGFVIPTYAEGEITETETGTESEVELLIETETETETETELETETENEEEVTEEITLTEPDDYADPEDLKVEEASAAEPDNGISLMSNVYDQEACGYGVDVYSGTGKIDWQKVKDSGVKFAFIRVACRGYSKTGTLWEDERAKENLEAAIAAGIKVGVYTYSQAITEKEALQEAKLTCEVIKGYKLDLPVVFDYEGYWYNSYLASIGSSQQRVYGTSTAQRMSFAKTFLDYVEAQGYKGMHYASKSHLLDEESWDTDQLEDRYDIWVAQYPYSAEKTLDDFRYMNTSYDRPYAIWQCSSYGSVPGISRSVDLNICYYRYWDDERSQDTSLPVTSITSVTETDGIIRVSWEKAEGVDGYVIYRRAGEDDYKILGKTSSKASGYNDSDTESGIVYEYKIATCTKDDSGYIKDVSEASESVKTVRLDAPEITKTECTSEGIKITFSNIQGVGKYLIYRKCEDDGEDAAFTKVASLSRKENSYLDATAETGKTYSYYVKSYLISNATTYVTKEEINYRYKPGSYQDVAGRLTGSGIVIQLTADDPVTKDGLNWRKIWIDGSYYYIPDKYIASLTSLLGEGVSRTSPASETVTAMYLPSTASVKVSAGDGNKIVWAAVSGISGYNLYRKTDDGNYELVSHIEGRSNRSYIDSSVTSGKTYQYAVTTYKGDLEGMKVESDRAVYLKTPVLRNASNVGRGVKISWKKVTGAEKYMIYRRVKGGSYKRIKTVSGEDTLSYIDESGTNKTRYYYTVRAVSGSDMSSYNREGISCVYTLQLMTYVATTNVNYRTGPGKSYSLGGTFSKGQKMRVVYGYKKVTGSITWYKIYKDGKYYYISKAYIRKVS